MKNPFIVIPENINLEEKIALLKQNGEKAAELRKEIQQIQTNSLPIKVEEISSSFTSVSNDDIQGKDESLQSIYFKICFLENLDREELIVKMREILKDNFSLSKINQLKIMLYQDIVEYANLALGEQNNIPDVKKSILDLRLKLELLDEMEEKEEIAQISGENNQLFFLESTMGNVVVLESIRKNIPLEYYDSFKELFDSILNGTFKGFKILKGGLYEVKDFKIRVLFGILEKGKYLILDAFMKKEDTSEYYKSLINNRLAQYIKVKQYYLEHINEDTFIAQHDEYLKSVLTLLDRKNELGEVEVRQ